MQYDGLRIIPTEYGQRVLIAADNGGVGERLESDLAFYASHVRLYIEPSLGLLRAAQLRPGHVETAISAWSRCKRNDGNAVRSRRALFNTVRTMLRWGARMGLVVRNAADSVDPPRFERKEMEVLDPAGVARLLRAAQGTELQAVIAVAIATGLRRGELLALRWSDVDLDARLLNVRRSLEIHKGVTRAKPPKTSRSARTIALPGAFSLTFARFVRSSRTFGSTTCGTPSEGWRWR
jgi:integrase